MTDLTRRQRSSVSGITGEDEQYIADVIKDFDRKK